MTLLRRNQLEANALYQLVTRDFNGNVENEDQWVRVYFNGETFRSVDDGDYWGEWLSDVNDDGTLDVVAGNFEPPRDLALAFAVREFVRCHARLPWGPDGDCGSDSLVEDLDSEVDRLFPL